MALYIILGIVALITALLFIQIKLTICYKEQLFIKIKYIITVYDNQKKKTLKARKSIQTEKTNQTISKVKQLFKSFDSVLELFRLIKSVLTEFGKYLKKVKVLNFKFSLTIAGEDAASTAIKYGLACSVIYPVLTLASNTVKLEPKQVDINTDFTSDNFLVGIYTDILVRPIHIIRFVISFAWIYIKSKIERNKK